MKTQTLTIDSKMYTRVIAAFVVDEDQKRAFKSKGLCQIGNYQAAQMYAENLDVGMELRLAPLSWVLHPSLQDPVLCGAWINDEAQIILVRAF